jgi:hypothetical protein
VEYITSFDQPWAGWLVPMKQSICSRHLISADRTRHIVLSALSTVMDDLKSLELGILWEIASVLKNMTGKSEIHFLVTTGESEKRHR